MRIALTLSLFVLLQLSALATETVTFDIILFGDKVGQMTVTKTDNPDGTEHYTLESHLKAKVLWILRENTSKTEVVYKNGKFLYSIQKEIENGEVKRWNNTKWDGTKLQVDGYKGKRSIAEQPSYSIPVVYFKGLNNIHKLFYEAEADYCTVEKVDNDTWEFKSPDGTRNVYHFVNGKIHHMEFHVSIATVKMVRTN
ncbi:MAG TPA: DUF6134 family protein [Chitinophagales bacterium]|nr:DUF6134 family protein [Chitinophagales bacterium]